MFERVVRHGTHLSILHRVFRNAIHNKNQCRLSIESTASSTPTIDIALWIYSQLRLNCESFICDQGLRVSIKTQGKPKPNALPIGLEFQFQTNNCCCCCCCRLQCFYRVFLHSLVSSVCLLCVDCTVFAVQWKLCNGHDHFMCMKSTNRARSTNTASVYVSYTCDGDRSHPMQLLKSKLNNELLDIVALPPSLLIRFTRLISRSNTEVPL